MATPRLPPGHRRRTRLIDHLDSVSDSAIIIVRAPAGGGKTSLISDWVRHRDPAEGVIWLRLDSWLPKLDALRAEAGERLRRMTGPVNIVVDDAHLAAPGLIDEMLRFAQGMAEGRVILLAREFSERDLDMWRVQLSIAVLSTEMLTFTVDEIVALFDSAPDGAGDADADTVEERRAQAERLHGLTGGHPLLTRVALSAAGRSAADLGAIAAQWVTSLTPSSEREFALCVALVSVADAGLASQFPGVSRRADRAKEKLARLAREGLGTIDDAGFFRYHKVVGAALRAHAETALDQAVKDEVRVLAAARLRHNRVHSVAGLRLLSETGQFSDMWAHFAGTFADVIPDDVGSILDALPPGAVDSDGMAATIFAVVQGAREPIPSIGLLSMVDVALQDLEGRPVPESPDAIIFGELAILALLWSAKRHEAGAARAEALLQLVGELGSRLSPAAKSAAYWGLLYSTVMLTLAARLDKAEEMLLALDADRDELRVQRRRIVRGLIHAMRGEVRHAVEAIEGLDEQVADSPEWMGRIGIVRAVEYLEGGDARAARKRLRALEPTMSRILEWPFLILVIARTHMAVDSVVGLEDVRRLLRLHASRPLTRGLRNLLNSAVADLALAAGEIRQARALVEGFGRDDYALRMSAARIALITGDQSVISDLRALTQTDDLWPRLRAHALLLLAVHLHRAGDIAGGGAALRRALTITGSNGIRLIISLIPQSEFEAIVEACGVDLPPTVNRADPYELQLQPVSLTRRERHLLARLASAETLQAIADTEFVALSTVKSQAASIYRKLDAGSRREAVSIAERRGLLGQ